jgi:hypothetical protein
MPKYRLDLLYFPVSNSVGECEGNLLQHVICVKSDKGPTRQPLDGCREFLQHLTGSL